MIITKRTKRFLKKMYLKGVILGYHGQRRGKDKQTSLYSVTLHTDVFLYYQKSIYLLKIYGGKMKQRQKIIKKTRVKQAQQIQKNRVKSSW